MNRILLILLVVASINSFGQLPPNTFKINSYTAFDLTGGYDVGSVVSFKKKKISAALLTREDLQDEISKAKGDTSVLSKKKLHDLPQYTYDKTSVEKARLAIQINQSQTIPADVKAKLSAALSKAIKVSLKVDKGRRFQFASGSSAARRMLYELPKRELCIIRDELSASRNPIIVSEALIYDSASVTYDWGAAMTAELATQFQSILGIDASYAIDQSGRITAKYNHPVITQFKYIELDKSHMKTLRSQIAEKGGCQ